MELSKKEIQEQDTWFIEKLLELYRKRERLKKELDSTDSTIMSHIGIHRVYTDTFKTKE